MLERVDRMLLAVRDRAAAEATFRDVLGAETVQQDTSAALAARRTVMQAGISEFELLEPAGDGPIARWLERWGEGIFAAGFSTRDMQAICSRLSARGISWQEDGGRLFIANDQTPGMNIVISPDTPRSPVGRIRYLYEVTNIVHDHVAAASFYAGAFGLDASRFHPIRSEEYGYTGQLTLFDPPNRLDRIELAQIEDPSKPMGRFAARRGQSIYMGFVEADDVGAIARRLDARGARYAGRADAGDEIFIHPTALHGVLLGVSRTTAAWRWSGRPDLVRR